LAQFLAIPEKHCKHLEVLVLICLPKNVKKQPKWLLLPLLLLELL
jgi:hypothetical protein